MGGLVLFHPHHAPRLAGQAEMQEASKGREGMNGWRRLRSERDGARLRMQAAMREASDWRRLVTKLQKKLNRIYMAVEASKR